MSLFLKVLMKFLNDNSSLSLIFTNTITKYDLNKNNFDIRNTPIDEDSISLYDLIVYFNNEYLSFKKEYNDMEKLNIGKKVSPLFFKDDELVLGVTYPTIVDDDLSVLHIINKNNEIKCTINNMIYKKNTYNKEVDIDKEIARKYFDLFKKYNHIMKLYNELLTGFAMTDGTYTLSTISSDSNIIDDIENIIFSIDMNQNTIPRTRFEIAIKPGNEIEIDKNDSKITIGGNRANATTDDYIYILKNIYIHRMYANMIDDIPPKEKIKTKKNS